MVLDLSAPKLLIPENFEDKNAAIIVVDFGKFLLTNQPGDHAPGHTRSFFNCLGKWTVVVFSAVYTENPLCHICRTKIKLPLKDDIL